VRPVRREAAASRLGLRLSQTVTVDNRSGAHGSIASE
jgi:tripartite-type tricarboxylate transporter receptor subunit TctC